EGDRIQTGKAPFSFVIEKYSESASEAPTVIVEVAPLPQVPIAHSVPPAPPAPRAVDEAKHVISPTEASVPIAPEKVEGPSPQVQAQVFIDEAKKKAAQIVAQSYGEAEKAAQSVYDQAQMDRKRLQQEGEILLKQAQTDSQSILDSAEKLAQEMMDDARKVAADLREKSRSEREHQLALFEKELSLEKSKATAEIQKARDSYKEVLERSFEQEKKMKLQELESQAEFELKNKLQGLEKENQALREESLAFAHNTKSEAESEAHILKADVADYVQSQRETADRYVAERIQSMELLQKKHDEEYQVQREGFEKELHQVQHKISKLGQELEKKSTANQELSLREKELEKNLANFVQKVEALNQEIGSKEKSIESLTSECKNREEYLKKLESQFFETNAKLDRELSQKQSLHRETMEKLDQDYQVHLAQLEDLKREAERKAVELKTSHEVQVQDLKDKYEALARTEKQKYEALLASEMKEIQKQKEKLMEGIWAAAPNLANELALAAEKSAAKYVESEKISALSSSLRTSFEEHLKIKISKMLNHHEDRPIKQLQVKAKYPWQPFIAGASTMVLALTVYVGLAYQMDWSVNPVQRALKKETQARQQYLAARKFNPPKDQELRNTLVESVIYTQGFVESFKDEQWKSDLMKSTMMYMLRTFEVPEEKSIAAIAALQSTVLELEQRKEKIHPDFVSKDLAKMNELEQKTKEELKSILGTEVRVEALLQHQAEYLKQNLIRQPASQ
ncbi:MAG: hypothetical protein ACK5RO_09200, partial [Pseudobdellovibrionaceae bacterium]